MEKCQNEGSKAMEKCQNEGIIYMENAQSATELEKSLWREAENEPFFEKN